MAHALHDPVRHNVWATAHLLTCCRGLDEQTLNASVPGAYGSIIATLRHVIYCERDSLDRLLGRELSDLWQLGNTTGLDVLTEQATLLASDWELFLAGEVDSEQPLPPDEGTNPIPAGVVIAVVLYHGSEHRGQICTILSAHGHEPPDLTPWAYAFASGRIRT
ncbi:MAG TPA: DinB family protein [Caldilineaceae bacterium]|nr:DinB family protein [Caldilineaceae bacterium]